MYAEELAKINYYKERIIKEFAKNGIHPDNTMIKKRLEKIDKSIAIYQPYSRVTGEYFDAKEFNEDIRQVYADLKILYQLAYDLCVKDMNELQSYAETHLTQLETLAQHYQRKTQMELNGTYLGKTIYFQTYGYKISGDNGVRTIDLGSVDITPGGKLACIFEPKEQTPQLSDVSFVFTDKDDNTLSCSPYELNKDTLTIPGKSKITTYSYTPPTGSKITSSFQLTPEGLTPTMDNTYLIYSGKDRICTGTYDKIFTYKTSGVALNLTKSGKTTFYILNGTYIQFDFKEEPISKNFNGTSIKNMGDHKKIIIEHGDNFIMDFTTDGTIYASCEYGTVKNGALYYPGATNLTDFMIEEYSAADKAPYQAKVIVNNSYESTFRINAIAIKEMNSTQEEGFFS